MSTQVGYYEAWRDLMRSWGYTVHEASGWRTRDAQPRRAYLPGKLYVEHHDASTPRSGNWGALNYIINNRLANVVTARNGEKTITAAGVANHAGVGSRNSLGDVPVNGANYSSLGDEVANSGSEPYSAACTDSIVAGEAAWAIVSGRVDDVLHRVVGHKEWADPPGRKTDPSIDMDWRRREVAAFIQRKLNEVPAPAPVPVPEAAPALTNIVEEIDVKNLILGRNAGVVWAGDGLQRRRVEDNEELAGLQWWIGQKGGDATVYDFQDLRVLGAPVPS